VKQNLNQFRSSRWVIAVGFAALTAVGCAGGPLTAREKGAGIGAVGGAAAGGLIGAAAGRPGLGAAIGGGVGLGANGNDTSTNRSSPSNDAMQNFSRELNETGGIK
jgi:hypothetical protein